MELLLWSSYTGLSHQRLEIRKESKVHQNQYLVLRRWIKNPVQTCETMGLLEKERSSSAAEHNSGYHCLIPTYFSACITHGLNAPRLHEIFTIFHLVTAYCTHARKAKLALPQQHDPSSHLNCGFLSSLNAFHLITTAAIAFDQKLPDTCGVSLPRQDEQPRCSKRQCMSSAFTMHLHAVNSTLPPEQSDLVSCHLSLNPAE
jgi:hypothetical protein